MQNTRLIACHGVSVVFPIVAIRRTLAARSRSNDGSKEELGMYLTHPFERCPDHTEIRALISASRAQSYSGRAP